LLDDHVTVRPPSMLPFASRRIAVSCFVPPPEMFALAGVTVIVDTAVLRVFTEIVA
jgi:hypothetical protein